MATWAELAQGVLTHGIDALAETQVARYQANDPTPNNRGNGSTTSLAGQPAFQTITEALTNPTNIVLLGVAAVLVFVLVKGRS